MTDEQLEQNILTTRPSFKTIGFGLLGTVFFGAFVYLMLTSKWSIADGTDYKTGMTIMWVTLGVFVFFSVACFFWALSVKTVVLTNKSLIIKRPLFLLKLTVPLSNIKAIREKDYEINTTHDWIDYNIFKGDETIIELKSGKRIKLNSFEISDYYTLTKNLNKLLRNNKQLKLPDDMRVETNRYEGYGWILFLVLLTFGLVYSIIRQKL